MKEGSKGKDKGNDGEEQKKGINREVRVQARREFISNEVFIPISILKPSSIHALLHRPAALESAFVLQVLAVLTRLLGVVTIHTSTMLAEPRRGERVSSGSHRRRRLRGEGVGGIERVVVLDSQIGRARADDHWIREGVFTR